MVGLLVAAEGASPEHRITGNLVFNRDVYLALAGIEETACVSPERAVIIAKRLRKFLHDAGYMLAEVDARARECVLEVDVDEGLLNKVIVPDESGLTALALQLTLDLPHKVFNKPSLDRQISHLNEEYGLEIDRYELVRTSTVVPQQKREEWMELPKIRGETIAPIPGHYELRLYLVERDLPTGVNLHLGYESPDGLTLGVSYRTSGWILDDERWEIRPIVALRIQDLFSKEAGARFLSRSGLALRYYSPAFAGDSLRLVLVPHADLLNRERRDLGILAYDLLQVDASVLLWSEVTPGIEFQIGGGVDRRHLLDVDEGDAPFARTPPLEAFRPFLVATTEIEFGTDILRADRRHNIAIDARQFFAKGGNSTQLDVSYERAFGIGWDQVVVGARATALFGRVSFVDEIPLSAHLRGVFGSDHFTDLGASAAIEYQVSLVRDIYKFSVFNDLAAYRAIDREDGKEKFAVGDAAGFGFHALIVDTFETSLYFSFAFLTEDDRGRGISLEVSQIF